MDDPEALDLAAGGVPPGDAPTPPPSNDQARRLAELERELAKTRAERDQYKADTYRLLEQLVPYQPLTPEEVHDMFHGSKGPPLSEIIAEIEAELGETLLRTTSSTDSSSRPSW